MFLLAVVGEISVFLLTAVGEISVFLLMAVGEISVFLLAVVGEISVFLLTVVGDVRKPTARGTWPKGEAARGLRLVSRLSGTLSGGTREFALVPAMAISQ